MSEIINIHYDRTAPFEDMYLHFNFPQSFDTSKYRCLFKLQKVVWTIDEIINKQVTIVITKDIVDQLCPGIHKGLLQLINDSEEFQNILVQEFNISKEVESSPEKTVIIPLPSSESEIETHNLNPASHPYLLNQISLINSELDIYGDIVTHDADEFYPSSNPNNYMPKTFLNPFNPLQYDPVNGNLWVKNTHQITTVGEVAQIHTNQAGIAQEIIDRTNADNTLQDNIDTEEASRISADNTLQANIDTEATTRATADTTLQTNINTEATTRFNADETLQDNIDAEEQARSDADEALQDNIDTEEEARQQADQTLQNNIDTKVTKNNDIVAGTYTKITYDTKGLVTGGTDITLSDVTDITATASEVNILDGITATTSELNVLDGITATTTELNYTDGVTSNIQTQINSKLNITDVINNVTTTTTNQALAANQGKELQDQIDNLKARGRFLALWNCATGLAESDPSTSPRPYNSGDYFIIGVVASSGGTNYRPDGTQYVIGQASTTVETATVNIDDVYYYDGSLWKLQINTRKEVTFASIAGQPTDNTNLASALNAKVNKNNDITAGTHTKITYDAKGLVTGGTDLAESDIPSLHLTKITDVTASASEVNVLDGITATTTELNYVDGVTSNIQTQLNNKVEKNNAITSATKTKITYDAKGLVTGGADLIASDIPNLTLVKISDVTATASELNVLDGITATTTELNYIDGVTSNIQTQLNSKLPNTTKYGADLSYSNSSLQLKDQDGNALGSAVIIESSPAIDNTTITKNSSQQLQASSLVGLTSTVAELNYVDGVTSNIQTQIDSKQDNLPALESGKYLTNNGTNLSWATVQQAPSTDNETVSLNSDNELQAIGVINNQDGSTALKYWTGTLAQYNAITTKDANTIYNITDDEVGSSAMYTKAEVDTLISNTVTTVQGLMNTQLSTLYPIGSIYIGTTTTCPLATLISGSTWVLVGEDRVLQGAGTRGAVNTTLSESLPNITGTLAGVGNRTAFGKNESSGAFYTSSSPSFDGAGAADTNIYNSEMFANFDASHSSSVYQNNAHVQPSAYLVNIWRRVL